MDDIRKPLVYIGSYSLLLVSLGFHINSEIRITENHMNSWNSFSLETSDALASGNNLAYVLDCVIQKWKLGNTLEFAPASAFAALCPSVSWISRLQ